MLYTLYIRTQIVFLNTLLLGLVLLGIRNLYKGITVGEIVFCEIYEGCYDILYEENPMRFLSSLGIEVFLCSLILYLYYRHFFEGKKKTH